MSAVSSLQQTGRSCFSATLAVADRVEKATADIVQQDPREESKASPPKDRCLPARPKARLPSLFQNNPANHFQLLIYISVCVLATDITCCILHNKCHMAVLLLVASYSEMCPKTTVLEQLSYLLDSPPFCVIKCLPSSQSSSC